MKITKFKLVTKAIKLLLFRVIVWKWYLPRVNEITVEELYEKYELNQTPTLLDLRTEKEFYGKSKEERYNYGHIPGAVSIPYFELAEKIIQFDNQKDEMYITICPGGGMSLCAADILTKVGYSNVVSLKDGMERWFKNGYPVTTD